MATSRGPGKQEARTWTPGIGSPVLRSVNIPRGSIRHGRC